MFSCRGESALESSRASHGGVRHTQPSGLSQGGMAVIEQLVYFFSSSDVVVWLRLIPGWVDAVLLDCSVGGCSCGRPQFSPQSGGSRFSGRCLPILSMILDVRFFSCPLR